MYPLIIDIQARTISFWAKVNVNKIPYIAPMMYDGLYILNEQRVLKTKWFDKIKQLLCSNGYGNIYESQSNLNVQWLSRSYKQVSRQKTLQ